MGLQPHYTAKKKESSSLIMTIKVKDGQVTLEMNGKNSNTDMIIQAAASMILTIVDDVKSKAIEKFGVVLTDEIILNLVIGDIKDYISGSKVNSKETIELEKEEIENA